MKKLLLPILAVILSVLFVSCKEEHYPKDVKFEVVSSPKGMRFGGLYGLYHNEEGRSQDYGYTTSVDTIAPAVFHYTLLHDEDMVYCHFIKRTPGDWTLTVKVYIDGELVTQGSTSEEGGEILLFVPAD